MKNIQINLLFFIKIGEGDKRMSEEEIESKIIDHSLNKHDSFVNSLGLSIDDLDKETLQRYREDFSSFHPDSEMNRLGDKDFLMRLGAYTKDVNGKEGLSNGAILFFGKWQDIIKIYPGFFLDYRYYERSNLERWTKRFTNDDFSSSGNIYAFYLRVREMIAPFLPNPFKRSEDGDTNINGRDILEACMEVVVNALSNASYLLSLGVTIKQTPSSFSVSNPGDIPVGAEQAVRGGISLPRNPGILLFFRAIGKAERSGFGVPKIYDVSRRYGYPEPRLSVRKDLEMTIMHISFLSLPLDTPSREAKLKVISYLSDKKDGASTNEIIEELGIGRSQVALIIRELLSLGIVTTNLKKRKGRRIYLNDVL